MVVSVFSALVVVFALWSLWRRIDQPGNTEGVRAHIAGGESAAGGAATLPSDARAFLAQKTGSGDGTALHAALLSGGREPSMVIVATAKAQGSPAIGAPQPITDDGTAILQGATPPDGAWSQPGRAGFAALMAGRSGRTDLVPAIEAMVAAPPSPADAAAGRYALSRLRR